MPRERFDPTLSGAHWEHPRAAAREVAAGTVRGAHPAARRCSAPPVHPRACPASIRKHAYAKYSEGQAAHWLLLIAGDRVDAVESALRSLLTLRPDNPITQTGVLAEVKHHGLRSRLGHNRADVKHHWMDPFIVGAPWAGGIVATYLLMRRMRRSMTG